MSTNRLSHLLAPAPNRPTPAPGAFMVCPLAVQPGWAPQNGAWQQVYAAAYEQARAALRPSRVERFHACLNN